MKATHMIFAVFLFILMSCGESSVDAPLSLFDGKSLAGWQGDTVNTWRVEDGMIVGGSLDETVPTNEFLVTDRSYENYILTLKIKLTGDEGFINSGVQFHSKRLTNPAYEMEGYQADWGKGYWASLYDESRRNLTLTAPDSAQVITWINVDDWNDYKVHAENGRIQLYINGHQTVDYTEEDKTIPQSGLIGLQIHGGGKAQVAFKDIFIEELPQKE
ncbi:DUF1080 domain-containing protein [Algoriphagus aquimarinus]|uniref:3-keto-disaccharide hydrolase n=1 Tax=Algoriphagus aquimarinus TaxID=237018 RepID=UPI0030D9A87B